MLLVELFDPVLLENESKLRQALKLYADRVERAFRTDHDGDDDLDNFRIDHFGALANEPDSVKNAITALPGPLPEQIIRHIKSFDPTPPGTYTLWMIDRWFRGRYRLEDLPRIRDYLDVFDRKRASIPEKDIQRYAKPQDVLAVIRPFLGLTSGEASADKMKEMLDPSQTTLLLDNAEWRVVMPQTKESAGFWGGNTEWCIAWGVPGSRYPDRDENYFNEYIEDGPFLIIHDKTKKTDWALHLAGGKPTLWDADDQQHDAAETLMSKPGWLSDEVRSVIRKFMPNEMALLEDPSDDVVERILFKNPKMIRYVQNPSQRAQEIVFNSNHPEYVRYISDPDVEVMRQAAAREPLILIHVKDPPEDLMLKAVEERPDIIGHLPTATERVQLRAMEVDGMMLGHIMPNHYQPGRHAMPSHKVIETAIRSKPGAIAYIEEPDEALQLLAVSLEGQYLASIRAKRISPKVAATAVRNSKRFAIHHVMTNSNCGPEAKAAGYLAMKEADPAFARDSLERYPDAAKAIRRVLGDKI